MFHQHFTRFSSLYGSRAIEVARRRADTGPSYQPSGGEHNDHVSQKLVRSEHQVVLQFALFPRLNLIPDRCEPTPQNSPQLGLPRFLDPAGHFSISYKRGH